MKETFFALVPAHHLLLIVLTAGGLLWQLSIAKAQAGQTGGIGKNAFYAEWFGNGVYYSLNCERIKITNSFSIMMSILV